MRTLMAGPGLPSVASRSLWPAPSRCHPQRPHRARPPIRLRPLASTVKEERKSTGGGRQGEDRTGSSRTAAGGSGPTGSGRKDGSPRQQQQPAAAGSQQPSRPKPQQRPAGGGRPPSVSRLDQYVRKHPLLSRFYDTTLLLGDCVMILATEASSERIEWSSFPALVGVLLVCWVGSGAWNGDYSPSGSRAHEDVPWQLSMLGPTFGSILGAALTWAFASTAAAAAYAVLVAGNALDPAPVVEGLNTDDLSPQLEVVVALLITMTCWRGIASRLRPTLPGQSD